MNGSALAKTMCATGSGAPRLVLCIALMSAGVLAGCGGGDYSQRPEDAPPIPQNREYYDPKDSIFGEEGLTLNRLLSGEAFGIGGSKKGSSLLINRHLWQASLDTLSFMPHPARAAGHPPGPRRRRSAPPAEGRRCPFRRSSPPLRA